VSDTVAQTNPSPRPRRNRLRGNLILALIVLIALLAGGWKLRDWWQARQAASAVDSTASAGADQALPSAIDSLRREQHALAQRLADSATSNRILRDEVLGLGERAALLEDSVARIAGPRAQGEQALQLDEVDLLLTIGQQQLQLAGDLPSALHAYALADSTLAASADPNLLDLRQTLAQEIAALRALPPDPRATLGGRLDALQANLDALPLLTIEPPQRDAHAPLLDRVLGSMVSVQRRDTRDLLSPAAREAGMTALRLEFTIARLALERRDERAFNASLDRIDGWLPRLLPPGTVLQERRQQLAALRNQPLRIDLAVLGTSLDALRRLRSAHPATESPAASKPAANSGSAMKPERP
jgi:uroporphyrin-3 C-methyltransferase